MSPETLERVRKAAEELNYSPNARARALRLGRTDVIGLYAGHGFVNVRTAMGPDPISRYNGLASADLSGGPAPGVSAGDAVAAMQEILARELPEGFGYEWTDLTYQQQREGSSGLLVFPLAVARNRLSGLNTTCGCIWPE